MRKIALVAGSIRTKETLVRQLMEYLDDRFIINGYSIDHDQIVFSEEELIVLSSEFIFEELKSLNIIDDSMEIIIAKRTINNDYLDKIVEIPDGTKVLFVNELPEIVFDVIEYMKDIGISHVDYVPFFPELKSVDPSIRVAITPGETHLVPDFITDIYDIGPRIMDFTTVTKILSKLLLLDEKARQFSLRYLQKTIKISKRLAESKERILELNQHLETVIDGLSDGLLVYDSHGVISVSNENFKRIIRTSLTFHVGRNINEILYNNELLNYLRNEQEVEEKIFEVNQTEYTVSKMKISSGDTVAKFRSIRDTISESDRLKREMIKKGFYAKYDFEDIVGQSDVMNRVKSIGRKLAQSKLTILIYGESGSGKELFASAIHNASSRKVGPFLAANFSALSDDLIESELFGYEEGAFTGAKKGGKVGLFEQAEGGTIFLDEIGDISLKMQARLLRVLQEKEIMRVGGTEIKPIDVRIISATNRNLTEMVKMGEFREDLYHRLKMGYIKLPPLRERKSDIPSLISHMLASISNESVIIEDDVLKKLYKYNWYGNVRELKNTIDYMYAVSEGNHLNMGHFPDTDFFQECDEEEISQPTIQAINQEYLFILKQIQNYNALDIPCGREKLALDTKKTIYPLTQYQMRTRLKKLTERGLIVMSKGRKGTEITDKGIGYIMGE